MAFVSILSQIKLLFGPLVIQLVWYILKQLITSVSVKMVDIYLHFGEIIVNYTRFFQDSPRELNWQDKLGRSELPFFSYSIE